MAVLFHGLIHLSFLTNLKQNCFARKIYAWGRSWDRSIITQQKFALKIFTTYLVSLKKIFTDFPV